MTIPELARTLRAIAADEEGRDVAGQLRLAADCLHSQASRIALLEAQLVVTLPLADLRELLTRWKTGQISTTELLEMLFSRYGSDPVLDRRRQAIVDVLTAAYRSNPAFPSVGPLAEKAATRILALLEN